MEPVFEKGRRMVLALRSASLLALAAGTMVLAIRAGGTSPFWSPDTINDEKFVRTCLDQDACYWFGMGTSVEWVLHGANFLHLKTLFRYLGAGDSILHWTLHAMLALAVVFTFLVGCRIAGWSAGLLGALLVPPLLFVSDLHMDVTYNHRVLPFLGALVALFACRAVLRGCTRDIALAACMAGLATNIHMQCAPFAASVPLAGALMPARRLRAGAIALVSLLVSAFLTSPDAWLANLSALVHHEVSPPLASPPRNMSGFGLGALLALGVLLALAACKRRPWRAWLVLALLAGPKVAGTEAASLWGFIEPESKYHIEVVPIVALALALVAWGLVSSLKGRFARLATPGWQGLGRLHLSVRALSAVSAGTLIAIWPLPPTHGNRSERPLTMLSEREFQAVRRFLTEDLGWNQTAMLRGLRGPLAFDALELLAGLRTGVWGPSHSRTVATLAKTRLSLLPIHLPPGFHRLASDGETVLVIEVSDSWLDTSRFRVCFGPRDEPKVSCLDTGIALAPRAPGESPLNIPGMPPVRRGQDVILRIEFAIYYPPGEAEPREVWMPLLRHGCSGRVADVRGGRVLDGGRGALLAPQSQGVGALALEWRLGTPECGDWAYRGFVPFFVEGKRESVRLWRALLAPLLVHDGERELSRQGGDP